MDLWVPIKTSKTAIQESSEPLANKRKLEKPKFAFVEYDINDPACFLVFFQPSILPPYYIFKMLNLEIFEKY
jgi:hypothetical protein